MFPNTSDPNYTLPFAIDSTVLNSVWKPSWSGKANRFGRDTPFTWSIIDAVSTASRRGAIDDRAIEPTKNIQSSGSMRGLQNQESSLSAGQII